MKKSWEKKLEEAGYITRRPEILALQGLLRKRNGSARVMLVQGEPGAGKTAFAEAVAKSLGSPFIYHLLHSWSDDQELFCGVDVAAAVAGDASHVRQPGVLARAAELSQQTSPDAPAVLCLDEVDKVQERTENLLLDFLQTGRVPVQPGKHIQARLECLLVFLTSNDTRPLSEPLLRRCRRLHMKPLHAEVVESILAARTDVSRKIIRMTRKVAWVIADNNRERRPSLQEMENLLNELTLAETIDDLRLIFAGWVGDGTVMPDRKVFAPLWAELVKEKRGGEK